jgi:hypothetical protein
MMYRNSEISAPESRADTFGTTRMSTLSRREEETLFKTTKAHALRECDPLVKGMFSVHVLVVNVTSL